MESMPLMEKVWSLCNKGRLSQAVDLVLSMGMEMGTEKGIYACVLDSCMKTRDVWQAKRIHDHIMKIGFVDVFLKNRIMDLYAKCGRVAFARQVFDAMPYPNVFSWNTIISGYVKSGRLEDARHLFDKMPLRNVVSWNTMIAAYARSGNHAQEAFLLFLQMQRFQLKPDAFTFSSIVNACGNLMSIEKGRQVHSVIVKSGMDQSIFVGNVMIDMYVRCGSMEGARFVFDAMEERDIVSWTSIVSGYAKLNSMEHARQMFDKMPQRNGVSWNAMIAGYAQNGYGAAALELFQQMQRARGHVFPTVATFSSVLSACVEAPETGKQLHAHMIKTGFGFDDCVGIALVSMYANTGLIDSANQLFYKMPQHPLVLQNSLLTGYFKCNRIDHAQLLFDKMLDRDVVSWNAMIAGYAQNQNGAKALDIFCEMQWTNIKPTQVTFVSVLDACAILANFWLAKQVHAQAFKNGFESNVFLGNTLIDTYAKCGNIEDARCFFDTMVERDRVSWNAIIGGHSQNGQAKRALQLFDEMLEEGIKPDHITFISILSACSYAGLVEEGRHYFESMGRDHPLTPKADHYTCMIDMLGRAGHLEEAFDFINNMSFQADASMWGALLSACRIHGNVELGEHAAEHLFRLEPHNAGRYVLFSNIYASAGRWDGVAKVRKMIKEQRVTRQPGCSWIQIKNEMNPFMVGVKP